MLYIVRTSSLSTFDSIEMGRYSDDLDKERDDKVAVLEFELRKAYDTIKSLRGSLTEATGKWRNLNYVVVVSPKHINILLFFEEYSTCLHE